MANEVAAPAKEQPLLLPSMKLAELKFQSTAGSPPSPAILAILTADSMSPLYRQFALDLKWPQVDSALLQKMDADNKVQLEQLDATQADAHLNYGDTEVHAAMLARAYFYTKIGDFDVAMKEWSKALEKAVGVGSKLDILFAQLRIALFQLQDHTLIQSLVEQCKILIDEGGDWDRRNRLKVYQGLYLLSTRQFKLASQQLLDGLATFTSVELMEYKDLVKYTVLSSVLVLERIDLKTKVLQSPEVLECVHQVPHLEDLMQSLYQCQYSKFFVALAALEQLYFKTDRYLHQQSQWYVREMRIKAYQQILQSYRSLTLQSMSQAFGVSVTFIDQELSHFIAQGRLQCVIDKVSGVVETSRQDDKNAKYLQAIKQGDVLLNHIQKLARVINI